MVESDPVRAYGGPGGSGEVKPAKPAGEKSSPKAPARTASRPATQSVEDYLERIHELIEAKGYARPVEIAAALGIRQSSVTRMMQRLHEQGYVNYEKHRGLTLTPAGTRVALQIRRRHETVAEFLRLIGVEERCLQQDTEGMEHHISSPTIQRLEEFLAFLRAHPDVVEEFRSGLK